ncbi:MAG TPA: sigma-70 family RNA polymerase sigma factor, partial [Ktedonobacterales bacterium]|nr:sigma-70 family RNA polymerase sigma factor [Ktedonobacterales bacterium]
RAIFAARYPGAVRLAVVSGLSLAEAQDCAQEAFIQAFERRTQLRDPQAFPLWFHRIVTRHILDALAAPRRQREASLDNMVELAWQPAPGAAPDELAELAQQRDEIWAWVRALPPRYRVPLALRYFGGFSVREVADLLGTREGTVRVTLHRALAHLRTLRADATPRQHAPSQP